MFCSIFALKSVKEQSRSLHVNSMFLALNLVTCSAVGLIVSSESCRQPREFIVNSCCELADIWPHMYVTTLKANGLSKSNFACASVLYNRLCCAKKYTLTI